jgi:hypothetical protein
MKESTLLKRFYLSGELFSQSVHFLNKIELMFRLMIGKIYFLCNVYYYNFKGLTDTWIIKFKLALIHMDLTQKQLAEQIGLTPRQLV